jgi:hypothetical protein
MTFRTPVPEGHTTVAQRFDAGCRCCGGRVPKGRMRNSLLNRPFGTEGCPTAIPALKRWAILNSSLRDEGAQIPVASTRATIDPSTGFNHIQPFVLHG